MAYDPNINFYDNPGHPYWPADGNWHEDGVVPSGGGVELGGMQQMPLYSAMLPELGNSSTNNDACEVVELYVGNQLVVTTYDDYYASIPFVAAGTRVSLKSISLSSSTESDDIRPYICKAGLVPTELGDQFAYTSVELWDGEYECEIIEVSDASYAKISLVIPELHFTPDDPEDSEFLVFSPGEDSSIG